jgi:hypothetical protein
VSGYVGKAKRWGINAELVIRDCSRQVALDFGHHWGKREVAQRLRKLDRLIARLTEMREALASRERPPEKKAKASEDA